MYTEKKYINKRAMDLNSLPILKLGEICKTLNIKNCFSLQKDEIIKEIQQSEARIQTHQKMIDKYEKKLGQNALEAIKFENENTTTLRNIAIKIGVKSSNRKSKEQILDEIKNSKTPEYLAYIHFELRRIYRKNKPQKISARELENLTEYEKGEYDRTKLALETNNTITGKKYELNEETGEYKEVRFDIRDE